MDDLKSEIFYDYVMSLYDVNVEFKDGTKAHTKVRADKVSNASIMARDNYYYVDGKPAMTLDELRVFYGDVVDVVCLKDDKVKPI